MIFDSNRPVKLYLFTWIKEKGRKSIRVETKEGEREREAFKTVLGQNFDGTELFLEWDFTLETINLIRERINAGNLICETALSIFKQSWTNSNVNCRPSLTSLITLALSSFLFLEG